MAEMDDFISDAPDDTYPCCDHCADCGFAHKDPCVECQ